MARQGRPRFHLASRVAVAALLAVTTLLAVAWPAAAQTAPAVPTNLTATGGHTQVTLAWTQGDDGGSPITGHEYWQSIDGGDNTGATWNAIPNSAAEGANATSYTVTGLSNGTTYRFAVRAVNAVGGGAVSNHVTPTTATTPAAPTGLMATAGNAQVTLRWTQGEDGGSPITGHQYRQGGTGATWTAIPNSAATGANATSYTVTGLTNGVEYMFAVRARNAVGESAASLGASATPAATAPAAPTNLKATAGHTQVTLKWTNGDDGGSPITRHEYQQYEGDGRGPVTAIPDSGPDGAHFSSYTVTGLRNGRTYSYRVYAVNAVGVGGWAHSASTTPMTADPPAAPTALTASAGDTRVTLAWTQGDDGGSPLNRHEYRQSTDTGTMWAAWTAIPNSAGNEAHATRYTVSGLTNGTSYTFQVRAVNAVGPGGPSGNADATPATSPPPPTLTATAGDTQVWLTWTSRGDGGRPLTGYEYRQQAGSEVFGAWAPIPASAPAGAHFTSYTVTGLTNGTTYTFQVRAGNAVGDGAAASPASATPMLTATVPPAPATLTATAGNAQVWLTWTSRGDGGSPLTGHEYRASTDGGGTWAAWTPIPASGAAGAHRTSYTVTRLTNGTTYTFQVRAGNAVGPGAASPAASATPVTVPAVPRSLTASPGDTEVTLKWTQGDDGGRPLTGYEYRQQAGSGAVSMWTAIPASAPAGQNGTGYTVTGLTNGTRYTFHVRAVSAEGRSPASPPASATPATVPAAPTTLTATAGNTRVTLAWTNGGDGGRPLTGHQYRESIDRGLWGAWTAIPLSAADEVHATRYTVTGLTNGTRYTFQVRAVNALGPSPVSRQVASTPTSTVTMIPRGSPSLTATTGNARVTLAWTRVDDGGSPLTRHEYRQVAGRGVFSDWTRIPDSAPEGTHFMSYTVTGLSNGTTYGFVVRAVNAVGESTVSNRATATPTTARAPLAPPALTATAGDTRVTLAWTQGDDGGSPITGHEYRQQAGSGAFGAWTAIPDSAATGAHGASYTVSGLTNGIRYSFYVRAVNIVGPGVPSAGTRATPVAVPPPPSLTATAGNTQVWLTWTSRGDGGSPLTGHEYRQQAGSGVFDTWLPIPDSAPTGAHVGSYIVTGLTNGTSYTFQVRAGNAQGDGAASSPASATPTVATTVAPTVPAAPPSLTATPGNAQVWLAWARGSDGGSPLTGHQYRQRTDSGSTWTEWTAIPDSAPAGAHGKSYTVTGLSNGVEYMFAVRAGNAEGAGAASPAASTTPGTVPAAPRALTATPGNAEVRLAWTRGDDGGSPLTGHQYRQRTDSGSTWTQWSAIPDSAPAGAHGASYTVTGLSNGTLYTFEVRAGNTAGASLASPAASATPRMVPAAPTSLTATPGNAQVTLAWTRGGDGGSPFTGHQYRQRTDDGDTWTEWTAIPDSAADGAHVTSYTVTRLTNGTTYTFEVRAGNAVGEGPASNTARATLGTVPSAPRDLTATPGNAQVHLAWTRGDDGGSPLTGHEYRQAAGGVVVRNWTAIPDSAPAGAHGASYTVTGLSNGTTYSFYVRAVNTAGAGPASNSVRGTPGAPEAPKTLTATPSSAQVTLTWSRGDDGGSRLLRHEYRQSTDAGDTWTAWTRIPDSAVGGAHVTRYTVTRLTNGTPYTFEVRAGNAVGTGPASNTASATPGGPGAPRDLTAVPGGAQVTLTWTRGDDGGSRLLRHEYRQSTDAGDTWTAWTPIPDSAVGGAHVTRYTVTGLSNGTKYTFHVRAGNAGGTSPASNTASATPGAPPATGPSAPRNLTATSGNTQVTLAWDSGGDGGTPFLRHEYRQQAGNGAFSDWTRIPDSQANRPHAMSYTVTGLSNGMRYTFEVRAVTAVGPSAASKLQSATPQLVTVPHPPTNLTAAADDAQVRLAWTQGGDGGRPLTEHQYRQSLDGGGTWAAWTPIPTSAPGEAYVTRYTVRGLTNGTRYTFQVRAVNRAGPGAVSNTAQARPTGVPTIVALALTSDPDAADGSLDDDTYIRGATVEVTVTFSEAVTVRGTPQLTLDLGGTPTPAAYVRGTGTPRVVFAYTIKAGDVDSDGLAIPANALTRPAGATLQNLAGTRDARVTHPAVPAQAGHRVDGVPPTLEAAELDRAPAPPVLVLTFSKPLAPHAVPAPEAFTIAVERPGDYTVTDVALTGATVTLTLAPAVVENPRGTVTYRPSRPPLQDVHGNAVAAFQDESLTVLVHATLSELTLPGAPLTPAFTPDRLSYTATVAPHVAALTLTATPTDPAATVALTPADADTATPAHDVALPFGRTTLQVTVTGVDTLTRQTYTVTVTRRVVSAPGLTAWLARFGRTVATQVTDAVGTRLRAAPGQGSQVTVGGYRLPLGERGAGAAPGSSRWGADSAGAAGRGPDPRRGQPRQVTLRDLLVGSTFQLTLGRDAAASTGPRVTAWGRIGTLQFNGHADTLAVDGDVLTGTLGVDGAWDRWLAGVAVSHSRGDGALTQAGAQAYDGALEQTLTSLQPYLRYAVTDRLMVWGLVGYGWGELTVAPAPGVRATTDTALLLGAVGSRGILLAAPEHEGFELATRTDVMLLRMTADAAAAGFEAEDAAVHRLRLVLEGSRAVTWAEGRTLRPAAEIGLRHDWGDAETGLGVEVGGQVQYADPGYGLTVDAGARVLLAHAASAYQEWGAWGTVRLAPGGQGLALTLTPAWGATTSGVEGLWARPTPAGLAPAGPRRAPGGRLHAEVGYAFAPGNLGVVTPYAGTVLATGPARTWRLGTRWQVGGRRLSGLDIILEGQRQNAAGPQPVNQGLHCQVAWGF